MLSFFCVLSNEFLFAELDKSEIICGRGVLLGIEINLLDYLFSEYLCGNGKKESFYKVIILMEKQN